MEVALRDTINAQLRADDPTHFDAAADGGRALRMQLVKDVADVTVMAEVIAMLVAQAKLTQRYENWAAYSCARVVLDTSIRAGYMGVQCELTFTPGIGPGDSTVPVTALVGQ